jgi:hypothetical protein
VSALLGVLALAMGQSDAITIVEGLAGLVLFVVAVSTIVTFLMWLHLAVRQTEALEINVGVTPGWAVGYWFIPFANLVKPYQTVRNLLNGLGGESLVSSARVSLWWALWIADNLFSQAETRLSMSGGLEAETSSAAHAVGLISSLLSIAGAILCIGIVRAAQQELDARRPPTG